MPVPARPEEEEEGGPAGMMAPASPGPSWSFDFLAASSAAGERQSPASPPRTPAPGPGGLRQAAATTATSCSSCSFSPPSPQSSGRKRGRAGGGIRTKGSLPRLAPPALPGPVPGWEASAPACAPSSSVPHPLALPPPPGPGEQHGGEDGGGHARRRLSATVLLGGGGPVVVAAAPPPPSSSSASASASALTSASAAAPCETATAPFRIPSVSSYIALAHGMGPRVASESSLASTLSRYLSVPQGLSELGTGGGGGGGGDGGGDGPSLRHPPPFSSPHAAAPPPGGAGLGRSGGSRASLSAYHSASSLACCCGSDDDDDGSGSGGGIRRPAASAALSPPPSVIEERCCWSAFAQAPAAAASFPPPPPPPPPASLAALGDDALTCIAAYLTPPDWRALGASARTLRRFAAGSAGRHLWVGRAAELWPGLLQAPPPGSEPETEEEKEEEEEYRENGGDCRDGAGLAGLGGLRVVEFVDRVGVATAGLRAAGGDLAEEEDALRTEPNLSALLGLAAAQVPTAICGPCVVPTTRTSRRVAGGPNLPWRVEATTTTTTAFPRPRRLRGGFAAVEVTGMGVGAPPPPTEEGGGQDGRLRTRTAVQYTGRVGEGDRSVTSDRPLPRPLPPPGEAAADPSPSDPLDDERVFGGTGQMASWSPRLSPIGLPSCLPSPTQALAGLLRSAGRVGRPAAAGRGGAAGGGGRGGGRPFVCPFVASEGRDRTVLDVTPRLVAYYEVSVLPPCDGAADAAGGDPPGPADPAQGRRGRRGTFPPGRGRAGPPEPVPVLSMASIQGRRASGDGGGAGVVGPPPNMPPLRLPRPALGPDAGGPGWVEEEEEEEEEEAFPPRPLPHHLPTIRRDHANGGAQTPDCIAIGLSTFRFRPSAKMPGWDDHSYGYHSDDGGIFHGAGDMEREFGPTYGVGDTVGCGVSYSSTTDGRVTGSIFFTLNGKLLGNAWTDVPAISMGDDLYPTVGVDTNCPLEVNFGTRPFSFDLGGFVAEQRAEIERLLGPLMRKSEGTAENGVTAEAERLAYSDDIVAKACKDGGLLFRPGQIEEWGEGVGSSLITPPERKASGLTFVGGGLRRPKMFR